MIMCIQYLTLINTVRKFLTNSNCATKYQGPCRIICGLLQPKVEGPEEKSGGSHSRCRMKNKVKDQGCALRKILGSPSGTQPFRLGYVEVRIGSPNKKKKIN